MHNLQQAPLRKRLLLDVHIGISVRRARVEQRAVKLDLGERLPKPNHRPERAHILLRMCGCGVREVHAHGTRCREVGPHQL